MVSTSTMPANKTERDADHDETARRIEVETELTVEEKGPARIGRLLTLVALAVYLSGIAVLVRDLGSWCFSSLPSLCRLLGGR